jgi:hypothetical protein
MKNLNLGKLALAAALIASWTAGPAGLAGTGAAASAHVIVAHVQPQAVPRGSPRSGIPQEELPCSGLSNVYGPATWWNESQSPTQWEELSGYYTISQTNQGTFYQPCGYEIIATCFPSLTCPGPLSNMHSQIDAMLAYQACTKCYAVAQSAIADIGVFIEKPKGKPIEVATLSTEGYLPIGLAVAKGNTILASVISPNPSGGQSLVLSYADGATTPTSTFADPAVGQNAAAIAVDSKSDIFLAFPVTNGSQTNLQIDEFPKDSPKPRPFASFGCEASGGIAVTKKGELVVACTSATASEILSFSPQGKLAGSFLVNGFPGSISLGKGDKTLTVVDSTDDIISTYAYPAGGTPTSSLPFTDQYGDTFIPTSVAPALNS